MVLMLLETEAEEVLQAIPIDLHPQIRLEVGLEEE